MCETGRPCLYLLLVPLQLYYFVADRRFVDAFINFPKPLVAAVNGPAIGISVTIMALYDFVYASDAVSVTRVYTHTHTHTHTHAHTHTHTHTRTHRHTQTQHIHAHTAHSLFIAPPDPRSPPLTHTQATFQTPFTQIAQSPEGCSSVLFPSIMGPAKVTCMTSHTNVQCSA